MLATVVIFWQNDLSQATKPKGKVITGEKFLNISFAYLCSAKSYLVSQLFQNKVILIFPLYVVFYVTSTIQQNSV